MNQNIILNWNWKKNISISEIGVKVEKSNNDFKLLNAAGPKKTWKISTVLIL